MAKKRLFGLDPKKLDKILSIGTEDPDGSDIEDKKLPTTGEETPAKRIDVSLFSVASKKIIRILLISMMPGRQRAADPTL